MRDVWIGSSINGSVDAETNDAWMMFSGSGVPLGAVGHEAVDVVGGRGAPPHRQQGRRLRPRPGVAVRPSEGHGTEGSGPCE